MAGDKFIFDFSHGSYDYTEGMLKPAGSSVSSNVIYGKGKNIPSPDDMQDQEDLKTEMQNFITEMEAYLDTLDEAKLITEIEQEFGEQKKDEAANALQIVFDKWSELLERYEDKSEKTPELLAELKENKKKFEEWRKQIEIWKEEKKKEDEKKEIAERRDVRTFLNKEVQEELKKRFDDEAIADSGGDKLEVANAVGGPFERGKSYWRSMAFMVGKSFIQDNGTIERLIKVDTDQRELLDSEKKKLKEMIAAVSIEQLHETIFRAFLYEKIGKEVIAELKKVPLATGEKVPDYYALQWELVDKIIVSFPTELLEKVAKFLEKRIKKPNAGLTGDLQDEIINFIKKYRDEELMVPTNRSGSNPVTLAVPAGPTASAPSVPTPSVPTPSAPTPTAAPAMPTVPAPPAIPLAPAATALTPEELEAQRLNEQKELEKRYSEIPFDERILIDSNFRELYKEYLIIAEKHNATKKDVEKQMIIDINIELEKIGEDDEGGKLSKHILEMIVNSVK